MGVIYAFIVIHTSFSFNSTCYCKVANKGNWKSRRHIHKAVISFVCLFIMVMQRLLIQTAPQDYCCHFDDSCWSILFASHTSGFFLNLLPNKLCVCVSLLCSYLRVYCWACMSLCLPTVGVCVCVWWVIDRAPAEVVGPQVQSIKTMGSLSWEHCISQEPSDWLLPGGILPWWRIRSKLRLWLHQRRDGIGAISLLLRAIDSIRQRGLEYLYSQERKTTGGRWKEMESCERSW